VSPTVRGFCGPYFAQSFNRNMGYFCLSLCRSIHSADSRAQTFDTWNSPIFNMYILLALSEVCKSIHYIALLNAQEVMASSMNFSL
jgi:hypothetical protein